MSGTPRPAATMRRTRALFAYSCCCAREHGHDAEACCQAWAVVAADRLCPLLVDTGPLLVDIGEGAVGPVRTVDDSPRPALFPRPCSSAAHRKSDDLAWRRRDLGQRSTAMESGRRECDRAREAGI